jgi:exonuclease VII small subunit
MARLLYKQDSTALHKRMARRHIRLCGQVKGGASYSQVMQVKLDNIIQKEQALYAAEELRENTYDDLVLKDSSLDDTVRTVFERTRQYDRENREGVSVLLFPDLTFSNIVNISFSEESKKINSLIQKLETLDATHELRPLADLLQQKVDEVNTAIAARQQAADTVRKCQVDLELARNEVRVQYEMNYLDVRKSYGKQIAESLFPKVVHRKIKDDGESASSDPED